MDAFVESVLSTFDGNTKLVWNPNGGRVATALFTIDDAEITVTFTQTETGDWRVGFEVEKSKKSQTATTLAAFRVFGGVFQAGGSSSKCVSRSG